MTEHHDQHRDDDGRASRLAAGREAIDEWQTEHGPLSDEELIAGLARARALLLSEA